jgi:hypothetical protein
VKKCVSESKIYNFTPEQLLKKQELDLVIQFFLILFSALSLSLGYYIYNSPKVSLALFTIVYCVKYCIEFYFSFKYSKK